MFPSHPTANDILRARVFEEPLFPIGRAPTAEENRALAAALVGYSKRSSQDDFSKITSFLEAHPGSPWSAALLTNLGLEYYNTGHYSKTLDAWSQAWERAKYATDPNGKAIADRAVGELAHMYARLGRMIELETLLHSLEGRAFSGPATEKICGAQEGLANMKTRPEIAFRCGPLALHRIKLRVDPENPGTQLVHASASTPRGFSLLELRDLSRGLELDYRMAFREPGAVFVVPSVVHFKVDHFAAIVQQEGDRYLLQDPTFGNDIWMTQNALEREASGYFLIPDQELERWWRPVEALEAELVRGKGNTTNNDPGPHGPCDPASPAGGAGDGGGSNGSQGLAVSRVHLMLVSLNIIDEPVGYSPPVGPAIRFIVRYNQRDAFQPAIFSYSNLGPKWTFDWLSYVTDNPLNPFADVNYYIRGGGTRIFTGFDNRTQAYAFQQYDQTKLTRTSPTSYEMVSRDGSRKIFSKSEGAIGSSRRIFLTQWIDPFGNTVSLAFDANLRITSITDTIGQVTTLSYEHPTDIHKITKVTDPFGRFATFDYDASGRLVKITDVIGITSEFTYDAGDFITSLTTPYGVTTFTKTENGNTRALETLYPDGDRDRVEYNQSTNLGIPGSDPPESVPVGMATTNNFLFFRNTFYWSKIACAAAYGDYTKAKIYHWLHRTDVTTTSGILESVKEPLEGRVWYDYAGQPSDATGSLIVGRSNLPTHVGRVLDDGSTQLYTYEYNNFGKVTKTVDPVGRTFSYIYADNGIDLHEVRQTRAGQNELFSTTTYNAQHLPLTVTDAAGQTTRYMYNVRGQVLTKTNAKGETTTYRYDVNGYLTSIDGPLAGASTTFTYDFLGRVRTVTDVSGYTLTFDYDALNRLTRITHPDGTFAELTYTRLDLTLFRDRASRQTSYGYDSVRQMTKRADPLNRLTLFQWCKCGALRTLTDPIGRTTTWHYDVQGRVRCKEYADGSKVTNLYEKTTSRLRRRIDEKLQVTDYSYNRDNTLNGKTYTNAGVATPAVAFTYDPNYNRLTSMNDGTGTTLYSYIPITPEPSLGAGQLASLDGPLPNDTITFTYDELGRRTARAINGVTSLLVFDAAGRLTSETNSLGTFGYTYDGATSRRLSISYPNGQTTTCSYLDNFGDRRLERITNTLGATPISEFSYGYDLPAERITTWSQKSGTQAPVVCTLGYDAANQLTSVSESQNGAVVNTFKYTYDFASNRLTEQIDGVTNEANYNALNQLTSTVGGGTAVTYEWDAEQRLGAINTANRRTEFIYDGLDRRVGIRQLVNGSETSNRRFLWCDDEICEERTSAGVVSKRFFAQGMKVEAGTTAGPFYYTRDHLGSIRQVTDIGGNIRTRYSYDPFGRQTRSAGDLDADFGFAGMFRTVEASLNLTKFRAYDPDIGRWLSRDPLDNAELTQGYNLYVYVGNDPINKIDPTGTITKGECTRLALAGLVVCAGAALLGPKPLIIACLVVYIYVQTEICDKIHDPDPEECSL